MGTARETTDEEVKGVDQRAVRKEIGQETHNHNTYKVVKHILKVEGEHQRMVQMERKHDGVCVCGGRHRKHQVGCSYALADG